MRLGTLVVTAQATYGNERTSSVLGGPGNGIICILQLLQVSQVVCKMKQSDFQQICSESTACGVACDVVEVDKAYCKRMSFCG